MSREIVNLDMDGVLFDFDGETTRILQEENPGVIVDRPRTAFYFRDTYPEFASHINEIHSRPGFFAHLPLIEGAEEGVEHLYELGYEPRILSSPLSSNPTCETDKRLALRKHFGPVLATTAIFDKQKHLYDGVALIDDRPNLQRYGAVWTRIIFSQPYNQGEPGHRIDSLVDEKLEDILEDITDRG